jgi:hypothetical protein
MELALEIYSNCSTEGLFSMVHRFLGMVVELLVTNCTSKIFFQWRNSPSELGPPNYRGSTITLRHITFGRTPLDEWSVRCRGLYLTTHNTHKETDIHAPCGIRTAIPASEQPQTHALDSTATRFGKQNIRHVKRRQSTYCPDGEDACRLVYVALTVSAWFRAFRRNVESLVHLTLYNQQNCYFL